MVPLFCDAVQIWRLRWGFLESFFPFPASRREGSKASSEQTEKQHGYFSWHAWNRGIPSWHTPWALQLSASLRVVGARKHRQPPPCTCPEHPVPCRGCEELQVGRERRVEGVPGTNGKGGDCIAFLGDTTSLLCRRPRTSVFSLPPSDAYTFCVPVNASLSLSSVASRDSSFPSILCGLQLVAHAPPRPRPSRALSSVGSPAPGKHPRSYSATCRDRRETRSRRGRRAD